MLTRTRPVLLTSQSPADAVSAALAAAQQSPAALGDLREALLGMECGQAVAWITGRLASGRDFLTGRDLELGQDGSLTEWPALRVFLLDTLFIIDPAAAAEFSRQILQTSTSPDKWALAPRNVGAESPSAEDVGLMQAMSVEMLYNEAWRKEASTGYLQAFDNLVHSGIISLSPRLIRFAGDTSNKPVRHAAFLTLDRLTLAQPVTMLEKLVPSAAAQPETALRVSNMVARADVRDPAQRWLVEEYLLDDKHTAAEIQALICGFPNANQFIPANLLTKVTTVSGTELAARDCRALAVA